MGKAGHLEAFSVFNTQAIFFETLELKFCEGTILLKIYIATILSKYIYIGHLHYVIALNHNNIIIPALFMRKLR